MADDYKMTALRMGQSSITLHLAGEFYNACYLGGYVIECYSKILLKHLGTPATGHALSSLTNTVVNNYLAMNSTAAGQLTRSGVMCDPLVDFAHILSNWNANKRYDDIHTAIWNSSMSTHYQSEINIALRYISKLQLDGLI